MTTATAPRVTREILEERWKAATTRAERFENEPVGVGNSKHYDRVTRAAEDLLVIVLQDSIPEGEGEVMATAMLERVWENVHREVVDTAEQLTALWAERREAAR